MNGYQVNIDKHNDRITVGVTYRTTQDGELRQVAYAVRESGRLIKADCNTTTPQDWIAANAAIELADMVDRMSDRIPSLYMTYHVRVDGTIIFVGMSSTGDADGLTWGLYSSPIESEEHYVRLDDEAYRFLRGVFTPHESPEAVKPHLFAVYADPTDVVACGFPPADVINRNGNVIMLFVYHEPFEVSVNGKIWASRPIPHPYHFIKQNFYNLPAKDL